MILRSWRAHAAVTQEERYSRHLERAIVPKLRRLAGFRGIYLLRRRLAEEIEYRVLTLWESMDAIRQFAGDETERAVVEPEARAALLRCDETVEHYDVVLVSLPPP